jgi:hypothetical protein
MNSSFLRNKFMEEKKWDERPGDWYRKGSRNTD